MSTTTLTFKFAHYAIPKGCKVGDRVILVRHTDTLKNYSSYSLVADNGEGYPDNNCGYKAYHGFRGSFNDDDSEALDHIDTLEWDAEAIPEA